MRNEEIHVLIERKITGSKDSDEHADRGQLSPQASGISSVTCTGLCSLQEVKNTCLKVSTTWATLCYPGILQHLSAADILSTGKGRGVFSVPRLRKCGGGWVLAQAAAVTRTVSTE